MYEFNLRRNEEHTLSTFAGLTLLPTTIIPQMSFIPSSPTVPAGVTKPGRNLTQTVNLESE